MKKKSIFDLYEEQQAQEPKQKDVVRMPGEEPAQEEPAAEKATENTPEDAEPEKTKEEEVKGDGME